MKRPSFLYYSNCVRATGGKKVFMRLVRAHLANPELGIINVCVNSRTDERDARRLLKKRLPPRALKRLQIKLR